MMIDLHGKPFLLDDEAVRWVEETLADMTMEDKIGQLFCLIQRKDDEWREEADDVLRYKPGGIMFRPLKSEIAWTIAQYMQGKSDIPMLIAANLERGGSGIVKEGTDYGSNMQVAAAGDPAYAEKQGVICAREALAVGGNWAFAPVIDIDYNFRNPITNTRTYGSDPLRVARMGKAYVEAVQGLGVAASIKHFPGDGRDERDQHLVTSINDMSCEDWDATYGMAYKTCIDAGALTVMVGHIMQPAYSRRLTPGIADDAIMPASLAPELLQGLLRDKLGFNGLITSDATTMVGMMTQMPREKAVPHTIAAGCDMFLFTRNLEEDHAYMVQGVEDGVITEARLDEAVTRILATKAAIGLHQKQKEGTLVPSARGLGVIGCEEHRAWTRECADRAVTLVKSDDTVPIDPDKQKRVLLHVIGDEPGYGNITGGKNTYFKEKLEREGFSITVFDSAAGWEGALTRYDASIQEHDLVIYFCAVATKSNQTTVRIEWAQPMGANCPIYIPVIPTIFISMENPYHLLDVPMVKTYINGYTNTKEMIDAIVDKLMGRAGFEGDSPVDAFCGRWDTHL